MPTTSLSIYKIYVIISDVNSAAYFMNTIPKWHTLPSNTCFQRGRVTRWCNKRKSAIDSPETEITGYKYFPFARFNNSDELIFKACGLLCCHSAG